MSKKKDKEKTTTTLATKKKGNGKMSSNGKKIMARAKEIYAQEKPSLKWNQAVSKAGKELKGKL